MGLPSRGLVPVDAAAVGRRFRTQQAGAVWKIKMRVWHAVSPDVAHAAPPARLLLQPMCSPSMTGEPWPLLADFKIKEVLPWCLNNQFFVTQITFSLPVFDGFAHIVAYLYHISCTICKSFPFLIWFLSILFFYNLSSFCLWADSHHNFLLQCTSDVMLNDYKV